MNAFSAPPSSTTAMHIGAANSSAFAVAAWSTACATPPSLVVPHRGESGVARSLFHALDPVACPRCETPVSSERRAAERRHQTCAVCAQPVGGRRSDPEEAKAVEREAEWRLAGSRNAERVAHVQMRDAKERASTLRSELAAAERRLDIADNATRVGERATPHPACCSARRRTQRGYTPAEPADAVQRPRRCRTTTPPPSSPRCNGCAPRRPACRSC